MKGFAVCLVVAGVVGVLKVSLATAVTEGDPELLKRAQELFHPLPGNMATPESPVTKERVDLGRQLFFDPRLTVDGNLSCASCHQPALYGTDALPKSIGVKHRLAPRNAPTILNSALNIIHWRGDRDSVEDQVMKALVSPITSGQPNEKAVVDRLGHIPGYAALFKEAFANDTTSMTYRNIAKAIGAFERTLVTPSPFDAYLNGKSDAISTAAQAGLRKFIDNGCAKCHEGVGVGGGTYQKFGATENYWVATGSTKIDRGRFDVTKDLDDLYVFRVPSLRNVAMTAPYFHDGSVPTLPEAVKIMARVELGTTLNDADISDMIAFLKSLTGELPANFVTVPTLPSGSIIPKP
jgi:cytochrome c peroxidase